MYRFRKNSYPQSPASKIHVISKDRLLASLRNDLHSHVLGVGEVLLRSDLHAFDRRPKRYGNDGDQ